MWLQGSYDSAASTEVQYSLCMWTRQGDFSYLKDKKESGMECLDRVYGFASSRNLFSCFIKAGKPCSYHR